MSPPTSVTPTRCSGAAPPAPLRTTSRPAPVGTVTTVLRWHRRLPGLVRDPRNSGCAPHLGIPTGHVESRMRGDTHVRLYVQPMVMLRTPAGGLGFSWCHAVSVVTCST
jgi:hypothetical protein